MSPTEPLPEIRLNHSEWKLMELLWARASQAPVPARELTLAAGEAYGWNKNTTYTILSALVEKKVVLRRDPGFLCTPLLPRRQVQRDEARGIVRRIFDGSPSTFLSAFCEEEELSDREVAELLELIESHRK